MPVGCSPFGGGDAEEETQEQLVEVVRNDLIVSVSGSGNIEASSEARLSFGTAGMVDRVYVEEGDEVIQGEVLAKLDTGSLELALAQAEAALETAEYNLEKAENPYSPQELTNAQIAVFEAEYYLSFARQMLAQAQADGDVEGIKTWSAEVGRAQTNLGIAQNRLDMMLCAADPEEVDLMELQVEVAEKTVEEAQKQLDLATLIAPFGGVVASVFADEGDTVAPGVAVIHLIDPTTMELKAEVDEIDIPRVKPGQEAIISVDALPESQFKGTVKQISLVAVEVSGVVSYEVTIIFNIPEDSGIRVGMSATVDIITYQKSNALLVPDRAIERDSEGNPLVRVKVSEQIEERPVVIGDSDGFQTEIIEGLDEGEIVVVETKPRETPSFFR